MRSLFEYGVNMTNPLAEYAKVQIEDSKKQDPDPPKRLTEFDFEEVIKPTLNNKERFNFTQNLRQMLVKDAYANLPSYKSTTYETINGILSAIDKQELDLMKLEQDAGSSASVKEMVGMMGDFLMNLPTNDKMPGFDPEGSGEIKELDKSLKGEEPVPGQTYIGVQNLDTDQFVG